MAGFDIGSHRPQNTFYVDAVVLVEIVIFSSQYGLLHLGGYLIEWYHPAIFITFYGAYQMVEFIEYLNRFNRLVAFY